MCLSSTSSKYAALSSLKQNNLNPIFFMQVKKQQLEPYVEPLIGSKLGKEYDKAVYCHPAYLTSVQSTSCEIAAGIKTVGRNISNLRFADDTTLMTES